MLGMVMFMAAWAMLFAGLFFAYGVLRVRATDWPPADLPRLPRLLPGVATVVDGRAAVDPLLAHGGGHLAADVRGGVPVVRAGLIPELALLVVGCRSQPRFTRPLVLAEGKSVPAETLNDGYEAYMLNC